MPHFIRALCVGTVLAISSCSLLEDDFLITGMLFRHPQFDCWVVQTAGETYEVTNLPDAFQHDSLAVRALVVRRSDLASSCQLGPIVEVRRITQR